MSPQVGVGVDNRTIRDVEDLAHGDGKKGESAEMEVFLEVVVGVSAHKDRAPFEAGKALECESPFTFRVSPLFVSVEMIVGDHSFPKGGDFIVRQADVATGDGTAGKSADKEVFVVPPVFLADAGEVDLAIIDGGLAVAPPSDGVLFFSFLKVGHGDPDESFASA